MTSDSEVARPRHALILGGAACVWSDVAALQALEARLWGGLVIATNRAGYAWRGRLDHWISLHPADLNGWKRERADRGYPGGYTTWSRRGPLLVDRVIPQWAGGSSGLFAVTVAAELGCTHAVLCGVPMTKEGAHFHERSDQRRPWVHAGYHWRAWQLVIHRMHGWVRSMSGRTRAALGAPTLEWLNGPGREGAA